MTKSVSAKELNEALAAEQRERVAAMMQVQLGEWFAEDMHAARVQSLTGALGALTAGALGMHAVGHGLAYARGLTDKHAIKQVDRLLSNAKLDVWDLFETWVPRGLRG